MKRILLLIALLALTGACNYAEEQGTVSVEVTQGKIVKIHEPGETYTTFGLYTKGYEVDLRNHMDGVDIQGVTKDNAPFYMKIDIVYHPMHAPGAPVEAGPNQDPLAKYLSAFGMEADQRAVRRWGVLGQLVKNAARDATSGKYDAYELRASQAKVLADIKQELDPKFASELFCEISSVGMEIQPQFMDANIDQAANNVVAAKKSKDAEEAWKAAAQTRLEKVQIENQQWSSSPQAFELEKLKLQLAMTQALANGIGQHQGMLILGDSRSGSQLLLQPQTGGK